MLSATLQTWESEGEYAQIGPLKHRIFYNEYGLKTASASKTLLLLHGFPESSYSYHKVITGLLNIFDRIVLFDMLGYGLSDKPSGNYGYSLIEQADIALQIWNHLDIKGGHLLAHDMGDSVATELIARHEANLLPAWFSEGFQRVTFTNGSMVLELASLRITQRILLSKWGFLLSKLSTFKIFDHQIRSAHGNSNLSSEDIALLWENVQQQEGRRKTHLLITYLNDRKRFEKIRWLPALKVTKLPIHICWGEEDAVAKVEMAHYLKKHICPSAKLTIMPGVGHFCQLGSPEQWVEAVGAYFELQK